MIGPLQHRFSCPKCFKHLEICTCTDNQTALACEIEAIADLVNRDLDSVNFMGEIGMTSFFQKRAEKYIQEIECYIVKMVRAPSQEFDDQEDDLEGDATVRFQVDGTTYALDFQREHKYVHVPYPKQTKGGNKIMETKRSTHPYTTVRVVVVDDSVPPKQWKTAFEATVGCWHKEDKFTIEKGRLEALRKINRIIPPDMKSPMWNAYLQR